MLGSEQQFDVAVLGSVAQGFVLGRQRQFATQGKFEIRDVIHRQSLFSREFGDSPESQAAPFVVHHEKQPGQRAQRSVPFDREDSLTSKQNQQGVGDFKRPRCGRHQWSAGGQPPRASLGNTTPLPGIGVHLSADSGYIAAGA